MEARNTNTRSLDDDDEEERKDDDDEEEDYYGSSSDDSERTSSSDNDTTLTVTVSVSEFAAGGGEVETTASTTTATSPTAVRTRTPPKKNSTANKPGFGSSLNEDAFSSSSDEDEDGDDTTTRSSEEKVDRSARQKTVAAATPAAASQAAAAAAAAAPVSSSEWDKALRTGKPSKGHAAAAFRHASTVTEDSNTAAEDDNVNDTPNDYYEPPQKEFTSTALSQQPLQLQQASMKPPTSSTSVARLSQQRAGLTTNQPQAPPTQSTNTSHITNEQHLSGGVLPDVLMTMRLRLESLQLFDSDVMKLTDEDTVRETLKRSSQQSISAAVLVSLAHKRYERRRLAAMEIEKVTRSLLYQQEMERIRAILILLSDDYVRSTSEDARKGGVVALAACAIALKRARDDQPLVHECRDLILASVVHACQDHSSRVRYYATESLFNVIKVLPNMAVQHFFILYEILRSLYADVDADVRSGAELLDKKLKEIIVAAMNAGTFTAEACVPVFARFVYVRHKPTKKLTLTWLQELNEKLLTTSPIVEFLHLFLGGIFDMIADPNVTIRESAILFLHSVLPKLLVVTTHQPSASASATATAASTTSSVNATTTSATTTPNTDDSTTGQHAPSTAPITSVDLPSIEPPKVDFDKILQSLVTTMEHPDPFVRKVAMYWMSRIVKAHCDEEAAPPPTTSTATAGSTNSTVEAQESKESMVPHDEEHAVATYASSQTHRPHPPPPPPPPPPPLSAASVSVRNSLPHILPGILLSIGDDYQPQSASVKDSFLPDVTTRALAEATNQTLQQAVRRDGPAFVPYLDGFIMALREELDSPNSTVTNASVGSAALPTATTSGKGHRPTASASSTGASSTGGTPTIGTSMHRFPPPVERAPYRMDIKQDGTGIESPGWFSGSGANEALPGDHRDASSTVMSRLCALDWVIVLYESVVPVLLKADYAREFIYAIIHQLGDSPPESIVYKCLEVLAKITVPVPGETGQRVASSTSFSSIASPAWLTSNTNNEETSSSDPKSGPQFPMTESNISFAFDILEPARRSKMSRNREVFAALIYLHSTNLALLADLSSVVTYMCRLQPPEFVFVSFAVELDRFLTQPRSHRTSPSARDLKFVTSFVQHLNHVLLNKPEAKKMREALRDCAASTHATVSSERDRQRSRLFHILLHTFAHNLAASISLCFWAGAYRTTHLFLNSIDPLDINLMFLLEVDRFIELLERPLFRHLHVRMLEHDKDPQQEGSGTMLYKALKSLLQLLPQSQCYTILKDRLVSVARFRQSALAPTLSRPASSGNVSNHGSTKSSALGASASTNATLVLSKSRHQAVSASGSGTTDSAEVFLTRVLDARAWHCDAAWNEIRSQSLEVTYRPTNEDGIEDRQNGGGRREWLGYSSEQDEREAHESRLRDSHQRNRTGKPDAGKEGHQYSDLSSLAQVDHAADATNNSSGPGEVGVEREEASDIRSTNDTNCDEEDGCQSDDWKRYWVAA